MDEVGPFELEGRIWADAITAQRSMDICPILWVVRKHLIEEVISKWQLEGPVIFNIEHNSVDQAIESILSALNR